MEDLGNSKAKRIPFKREEDVRLFELVDRFGTHHWHEIASQMRSRSARQCRERYTNYLDPSLKHGNWTVEEDEKIISLLELYGPKWSLISKSFTNRSACDLRNRSVVVKQRKDEARVMESKRTTEVEMANVFATAEEEISGRDAQSFDQLLFDF